MGKFMRLVGVGIFCCIFNSTDVVFAHHPNEGSVTLEKLISDALLNSREIQMAKTQKEIAQFDLAAQKSVFFPRLSLEGGPVASKFDENKNSGTLVYGKVEWNLYNGGRDKANTEKGIVENILAEKHFEATKAKIKRDVSKLYYEMLYILESLAIRERANLINAEQMNIAKAKKSSGFTSSADVIEFELREATIKSDLKKLNREKRQKSRELSILTGDDGSREIIVQGHLEKDTKQLKIRNLVESVALEEKNPVVVESKLKLSQSIEEKSVFSAGYLPQIDFEGKYGKLASEEKIFSESDNFSIALKLKIPLFTGMSTRNEVRAAQAKIANNETQLLRAKLSVKVELDNLVEDAESIVDRLELEEKNLGKAEEYYKITLAEYKRGVKNSPDMVSASEKLLDSKIRNLELRRDFQLVQIHLSALLGL